MFRFFRKKNDRAPATPSPTVPKLEAPRRRDVPGVEIDDQGVRRALSGRIEAVLWKDLVEIRIVTTDEGPFVDDVWWLFTSSSGAGCAISSLAVDDRLFDRLKRISGVNYDAVISAMGSCENATFLVWQGPAGSAANLGAATVAEIDAT